MHFCGFILFSVNMKMEAHHIYCPLAVVYTASGFILNTIVLMLLLLNKLHISS